MGQFPARPRLCSRQRVGLVIPAWGESQALEALLAEVPSGTVDRVFIVVPEPDDVGVPVARAFGATALVQSRPGYGAACMAGAIAATEIGAGVVAFLDGDYSDPPSALPAVLEPVLSGQADLCLGRRGLSGAPAPLPPHSRLGNALVTSILRVLLCTTAVHDLPSLKAIRADALATLALQETTYGWTTELVVKAVRAGLRVTEVPVHYRARLGGRSKVSGTLGGSLGAAWKLSFCSVRYARWKPPSRDGRQSSTAVS